MAKNYSPRSYGKKCRRIKDGAQVAVMTVLIAITFAGLAYMRFIEEDLMLAPKIAIGLMASCCLGYLMWMMEQWNKERGRS